MLELGFHQKIWPTHQRDTKHQGNTLDHPYFLHVSKAETPIKRKSPQVSAFLESPPVFLYTLWFLSGWFLLRLSLISIIDALLTHIDKHMSEFTHKCTFSRGSCCFCAPVIATRKAPEIFEITYCFSITASNFYSDA